VCALSNGAIAGDIGWPPNPHVTAMTLSGYISQWKQQKSKLIC